jgi:hypothetical protein
MGVLVRNMFMMIRIYSVTVYDSIVLYAESSNTYQGMFTDSISKAKKRATEGVRSIRSYFNPV